MLFTSITILLQWYSTQAQEVWELPKNETPAFNSKLHLFNKWGPDWRIEWNFTIVDATTPPYERPLEKQPWANYTNGTSCIDDKSQNQTMKPCPKDWFNVFHFSKEDNNKDREPGVWVHFWNPTKVWKMRVDLSEPHLNDSAAPDDFRLHYSWDWPEFHQKPQKAGDKHSLVLEQVLLEPLPGVNRTKSDIVIVADGKPQVNNISSRFVPRANMDIWFSDPWHLPAGEAVVKTDSLIVEYSKEWNLNTAFDCYLKEDFKLGEMKIVTYEDNCTQPAFGMVPKDGKFYARRGGSYYFSFTAYIKSVEGEYQLEMVKDTLNSSKPESNVTVVATIGLNQDIDWGPAQSTVAPATTTAPATTATTATTASTATTATTAAPARALKDAIWIQEARSKIMNAVVNMDVNDQVYVRVSKQSNPGNILLAKDFGTHFLGIKV